MNGSNLYRSVCALPLPVRRSCGRGAQMRGGTAEDSSLSDTSRFRPLLQDILEDISAGKLSADEYPVGLLKRFFSNLDTTRNFQLQNFPEHFRNDGLAPKIFVSRLCRCSMHPLRSFISFVRVSVVKTSSSFHVFVGLIVVGRKQRSHHAAPLDTAYSTAVLYEERILSSKNLSVDAKFMEGASSCIVPSSMALLLCSVVMGSMRACPSNHLKQRYC